MSEYQISLFAIVVGLVVLALFLHLPTRRPQKQDNPPTERDYPDAIYRDTTYGDEDQHWLGGLIYSNPDDPNLFVPKRFGFGWTLNFGHPHGKLVTLGLLVVLFLVVLGPLLKGSGL
jgi:uncharacterized membrane protein